MRRRDENKMFLQAEMLCEELGLPNKVHIKKKVHTLLCQMQNDLDEGIHPDVCAAKLREALTRTQEALN